MQPAGTIGNAVYITADGLEPMTIDLKPGGLGGATFKISGGINFKGKEDGRNKALAQFKTFDAWAKR